MIWPDGVTKSYGGNSSTTRTTARSPVRDKSATVSSRGRRPRARPWWPSMIDIASTSAARAGLPGASAAASRPAEPAANAVALATSNRPTVARSGDEMVPTTASGRPSAVADPPRNRQPTRTVASRIAAAGATLTNQVRGCGRRRDGPPARSGLWRAVAGFVSPGESDDSGAEPKIAEPRLAGRARRRQGCRPARPEPVAAQPIVGKR